MTGDAVVGVSDLLVVLSDFGCTSGDCVGDLTGDNVTGIADLLLMLGAFGASCE